MYKTLGGFHSVNSFFQGVLYTAVLVSGGYYVATGEMDVLDLATFALYIGVFLGPIEMLLNFTEQFQRGMSGFRRFDEVLNTSPDISDRKGAVKLGCIEGNIEYKNVSFAYDKNVGVLDNINLSIDKGRTIALVGPSGGGKTTLCSLLMRFYDVSDGAICIDGQDIRNVKIKSLRKSVGIVQQDVYLFSGTLKENIAYGRPDASDEEIIDAAKKANIHEFITGLENGYDTYAGERGVRLSGGQKQRVSIARVFLKNPQILILDEATSALDNESERFIQNSLDSLSRDRTTVVIAHRLSTIRNADEIAVIAEGQIKERGTHKDLLEKNGLYAKYYNMQFEDLEDAVI
jgi:ATP-binding cassette subfamily B protein